VSAGRRDYEFTGAITWVQVDVDATAAAPDHLIAPEKRFHLAMARQ
jgi:hypothetical protein